MPRWIALDRIDRAPELDQRAVPGELDDAAAVFRDQGLDEFLAMGLEARVRARFVRAHQPAIADHVGGQIAASFRSTREAIDRPPPAPPQSAA